MRCNATLGFQDATSGEDIRCTLDRDHIGNHEDHDHYRGDGMSPNLGTDQVHFPHKRIMCEAVMVSADSNARPCHVFCSIPGGSPWITFDPKSQQMTPVRNAPTIDNAKQFKAFVLERFADSAS